MVLELKNITKSFQDKNSVFCLLKNINFKLNTNEVLGLRAGNGKGKTSLLNIILKLDNPTSGKILQKNNIKIGVVFQQYSTTLFPWLNAKENILLPLKLKNNKDAEKTYQELIAKLNFQKLPFHLYPNKLSGGQKQRVAIARALINNPDLLILDEPFSSIDFKSAIELQKILSKIINETNTSVLLVSHNIDELIFLSNRILLFEGTPTEIKKEFLIDQSQKKDKNFFTTEYFNNKRKDILNEEYSFFNENKS